jgi:hypothetical protein
MLKHLSWLVILCFSLLMSSALAGTPAVSLGGGPDGTSTSSAPLLVGWDFSVTAPLSVDSLGLYTSIPFGPPGPSSGEVGLWDANQVLIASCDVVQGDPVMDGFKYHPITPVTLLPGQTYTIGVLLLHSEAFAEVGGTPTTFANEIDFISNVFLDYPNGLTIPPTGQGYGGFGPSFTFVPIPEPATFALAGLGAVVLIVRRRCK